MFMQAQPPCSCGCSRHVVNVGSPPFVSVDEVNPRHRRLQTFAVDRGQSGLLQLLQRVSFALSPDAQPFRHYIEVVAEATSVKLQISL
jgi:hypothetical protein